jgi:hypothetical protein
MIAILLFVLAGILNACMDVLDYRYLTSIFLYWPFQKWIDPSLSWGNKWRFESKILDFLFSTILVWLTDFWHCCKMAMLVSMILGVVFYHPLLNWWVDSLILLCSLTGTFEIFFRWVLIKK